MSSSTINSLLSQIYTLIEADQHAEAVDLLRPLLAEYPNNPDAWWLYAHAVTDIDDAHAALQTVLSLDPQYPGARDLQEQLEEASRGAGNPLVDMELQPIRTIPDVPDALPELEPMPEFERHVAYSDVTAEPRGGAPDWLRMAALALLFLCAIVGALLLSQSALAPGSEPTATVVAGDFETATAIIMAATASAEALGQGGGDLSLTATASAGTTGQGESDLALTATAIMAGAQNQVPTQEIDESAQATALAPLQGAFQSAFGETSAVSIESTSRGETLVVRLCSEQPGVLLRATLERALETLSGEGDVLQFGAQALGFRLVSCDDPGTEYRLLTASMTDVRGYLSGIFDAEAFQARLRAE